jgi:prevent-host-death family protein
MKATASVAELKARLSEYLRRVKRGDEIIVTERGTPVARLTALEPAERRATRRKRLVQAGVLRGGTGRLRKALLTPPAGPQVGRHIVDALIEEREDGR